MATTGAPPHFLVVTRFSICKLNVFLVLLSLGVHLYPFCYNVSYFCAVKCLQGYFTGDYTAYVRLVGSDTSHSAEALAASAAATAASSSAATAAAAAEAAASPSDSVEAVANSMSAAGAEELMADLEDSDDDAVPLTAEEAKAEAIVAQKAAEDAQHAALLAAGWLLSTGVPQFQ